MIDYKANLRIFAYLKILKTISCKIEYLNWNEMIKCSKCPENYRHTKFAYRINLNK